MTCGGFGGGATVVAKGEPVGRRPEAGVLGTGVEIGGVSPVLEP